MFLLPAACCGRYSMREITLSRIGRAGRSAPLSDSSAWGLLVTVRAAWVAAGSAVRRQPRLPRGRSCTRAPARRRLCRLHGEAECSRRHGVATSKQYRSLGGLPREWAHPVRPAGAEASCALLCIERDVLDGGPRAVLRDAQGERQTDQYFPLEYPHIVLELGGRDVLGAY